MPSTRRVFMTGATGFVGRAVIQALRAEGYAVRCLVRRGSERELRGLEAIERVEGNVLARETLERGMAGGLQRLQPVAREHVAAGFARAVALDATVKQTYEVVGPDAVTMLRLLDLIGEALGRRRVRKVHVPLGLVRPLTRLLHHLPGF